MSDDFFHLNRPVHLARRDGFYEQAAELIGQLSAQKNLKKEMAEQALRFFCEAQEHARAANRSGHSTTEDHLFLELLNTAAENTQSITRMLRRQQSAEEDGCRLCRFLGSDDVHQKMTNHDRRCAAHILKGLVLLLQRAAQPYKQLQEDVLARMSPADKTRYEKARAHLSQTLEP